MPNVQFKKLLKLPDEEFKRKNYGSRQIVIRSRKWGGIFSVYSNLAHDLWAVLEADPKAPKLFCKIEPIDVAVNSTHYLAAVNYATVDDKDVVTLHRIQLTPEDIVAEEVDTTVWKSEKDQCEVLGLKAWSEKHGAKLRLWSSGVLRGNEIYLRNLKKILGFTCQDGYVSNAGIKTAILNALLSERELSVHSLIEKFSMFDDQLVLAEICLLIQTEACACDIKSFRFDYGSKLSINHE